MCCCFFLSINCNITRGAVSCNIGNAYESTIVHCENTRESHRQSAASTKCTAVRGSEIVIKIGAETCVCRTKDRVTKDWWKMCRHSISFLIAATLIRTFICGRWQIIFHFNAQILARVHMHFTFCAFSENSKRCELFFSESKKFAIFNFRNDTELKLKLKSKCVSLDRDAANGTEKRIL